MVASRPQTRSRSGRLSKLAGDLLAVWLVIAADLPDGSADAFANMYADALNSSSDADADGGSVSRMSCAYFSSSASTGVRGPR